MISVLKKRRPQNAFFGNLKSLATPEQLVKIYYALASLDGVEDCISGGNFLVAQTRILRVAAELSTKHTTQI